MCVLFFFSSRRRHTRSYGDWSSDVCSSDLRLAAAAQAAEAVAMGAVAVFAVVVTADGHNLQLGNEIGLTLLAFLTAAGRPHAAVRGGLWPVPGGSPPDRLGPARPAGRRRLPGRAVHPGQPAGPEPASTTR